MVKFSALIVAKSRIEVAADQAWHAWEMNGLTKNYQTYTACWTKAAEVGQWIDWQAHEAGIASPNLLKVIHTCGVLCPIHGDPRDTSIASQEANLERYL